MAANVYDAIMLLGDSLTQGGWQAHGFAQQLAYVYNRKLDVINRGMSGYNTEWIQPVFEQSFAKQHEQKHVPAVQLLTIWLGANDAALPGTAQHVPLPTFSANLHKLIHLVTSPSSAHYSPGTRILLFTPPPINTHQWREHQLAKTPPKQLDRDFAVTRSYAQAVKDVGAAEGVPVVDLWTVLWEASGEVEENLSKFLTDGLHLNEAGYTILFQEIMTAIEKHYPEIHPDRLKPVFSFHDQIDYENPRASLVKRNIFE